MYENSYTRLIEHNLCVQGKVRLVVDVESADIMATLLRIKAEIEHKIFTETNVHKELKLTFSRATEAHILARELKHAKVGVLVHPRPYPYTWESKRMYDQRSHPIRKPFTKILNPHSIPGPPLTPRDFVSYLVSQGVEVGIMPQGIGSPDMDAWAAQNLRFDAGWVRASDPIFSRQGRLIMFPDPRNFGWKHLQDQSLRDRVRGGRLPARSHRRGRRSG